MTLPLFVLILLWSIVVITAVEALIYFGIVLGMRLKGEESK